MLILYHSYRVDNKGVGWKECGTDKSINARWFEHIAEYLKALLLSYLFSWLYFIIKR